MPQTPLASLAPTRRGVGLGLLATAAAVMTRPAAAQQQQPIVLFKVISPRDEVFVGLTEADQRAIGGADASALAKRLVADGQVTVWKYVVGRGPNGELRHNPQARVALLRNDTVRIEPYTPALPVASPQ